MPDSYQKMSYNSSIWTWFSKGVTDENIKRSHKRGSNQCESI